MIANARLENRFVQNIPNHIQPGVLYVSMHYGTAVHSCCCGCGEEVVTPLTPTDWLLVFDGEAISLYPSVGNWELPCRSHYVIRRNRVIEALPWTNRQIARGRRRDKRAKAAFFGMSQGSWLSRSWDECAVGGGAGQQPNEVFSGI